MRHAGAVVVVVRAARQVLGDKSYFSGKGTCVNIGLLLVCPSHLLMHPVVCILDVPGEIILSISFRTLR